MTLENEVKMVWIKRSELEFERARLWTPWTKIKPDYYITSKPKVKDEVQLRRCFRCG